MILKIAINLSENIGQSIAFMCIEKIKEFLYESNETKLENQHNASNDNSDELNEEDYANSLKTNTLVENANIDDENDEGRL